MGAFAEPKRLGIDCAIIRPRRRPQIGQRQDTEVDLIAEFGENAGRRRAKSVPSGLIDTRAPADRLRDLIGKSRQLLAFERRRKVAGIRIRLRFCLLEGWRIPWLEMGADFAQPGFIKLADRLIADHLAADGVIQYIGGADAIAGENSMDLLLLPYRADGVAPARHRLSPVELRFGVDHHDQDRRLACHKIYGRACGWV